MHKSSTKITTIILAILAIAILVAGFLLNRKILIQADSVIDLRAEVAESQDATNVVSIKREISKTDQYLALLDSYLVSEDSSISFIEAIEELGRRKGVSLTVQDFSISNSEKDKDSEKEGNRLIIRARAQSAWTNLMEFLILLENLPHSTNISELRLNTAFNSTTGVSEWSANLELQAVVK